MARETRDYTVEDKRDYTEIASEPREKSIGKGRESERDGGVAERPRAKRRSIVGKVLKYGVWKPIQYLVLKPLAWTYKRFNKGLLILLAAIGIGGYYASRSSQTETQHRMPEKRTLVQKTQKMSQQEYQSQLAERMAREAEETFRKTGSYTPIVNNSSRPAGEPVWDHPDKTPAEYHREGRLTTSQLLEDTGGDQFFEPEPLQLSPVTMIRKELSEAVSNGANYDKTADAVIYIQDTANPDNVIVFGLGVLPSQANKGCTSLLMTTMPSHLSGESRPMAGTRFNVALGDYRFNLRVEAGDAAAGEASEQVVIGYPDERYPTIQVADQHGGVAVALTDEGNRVSAATEGKTEEIQASHSQRVLNKAPDIARSWEMGGEPKTARVTASGIKAGQAARFNRLQSGR